VIPGDFKAELDRICALFAQTERKLNEELIIKKRFSWKHDALEYPMHFEPLKGRWRIFYGDKPINDCSAVEKVDVAEVLDKFEEAYIADLNMLAERAKKAGRKE
jgi:hypothetical protein